MKNREYRAHSMRRHLYELRARGVTKVPMKLSMGRIEQLQKDFWVEPYLYEIRTKRFYNVSEMPHILKDIHYAWKRGKSTIVKPLKEQQEKLLRDYGVTYKPLKYWVHLN